MFTVLGYVVALLVVGGLLFLAASFAFGRGEEMAPVLPEGTPVELPDDRPAGGDDLRALRLSVAVRGYRMDEVDWLLDRLAEQVDSRDREIARLRSVLHVEPVPVPAEPELLTHPAPAAVDPDPGAERGGPAGRGATAVRTASRPEHRPAADGGGHESDGHGSDGHESDGHESDGHESDGHGHDGGDGAGHDGHHGDRAGAAGGDRPGDGASAGARPRPVRDAVPLDPDRPWPANGDPTRGLRPDGAPDSR